MQDRERHLARRERLDGEVQQDRASPCRCCRASPAGGTRRRPHGRCGWPRPRARPGPRRGRRPPPRRLTGGRHAWVTSQTSERPPVRRGRGSHSARLRRVPNPGRGHACATLRARSDRPICTRPRRRPRSRGRLGPVAVAGPSFAAVRESSPKCWNGYEGRGCASSSVRNRFVSIRVNSQRAAHGPRRTRRRDLRRHARPPAGGRLRPDEHGRGRGPSHAPARPRSTGAGPASRSWCSTRSGPAVPGLMVAEDTGSLRATWWRPTARPCHGSARRRRRPDRRRPAGHAHDSRARRLRAQPGHREQVRREPRHRGPRDRPRRAARGRPTP